MYGSIVKTNKKESDKVQHNGLGKRLIRECETIAYKRGYKDIFITSGEGVINYYRDKLGYQLVAKQHNNIEYHYMYKNLQFHYLRSIQGGHDISYSSSCMWSHVSFENIITNIVYNETICTDCNEIVDKNGITTTKNALFLPEYLPKAKELISKMDNNG